MLSIYVQKKDQKNWQLRKRGKDKVISRLYTCSPRDKERFYLRILLTQIFGTTSYEDLCTINGNLYDTYEDAVRQLGLLDENDEFDKFLKEAATYKFPSRLQPLFAPFYYLAIQKNLMLMSFSVIIWSIWVKIILMNKDNLQNLIMMMICLIEIMKLQYQKHYLILKNI